MAEVLAVLGGAAALTQLIHYGIASVSAASALSHSIRHTEDTIDSWVNQSLIMSKLPDDIQKLVSSFTPEIVQILNECRKDATRLRLLLETCRRNTPTEKRSRISQSFFIMKNEKEVERIMSSYRSSFGMLASYFTM
jgi:disulfide bond formation protein DsbB